MPRKDGFPTNIEMMADFSDTARRFYIETFNSASERGFHPGFLGKPLPFIYAYAERILDLSLINVSNSVSSEQLTVEIMEEGFVDDPVPGSSWLEDVPEEIRSFRKRIRKQTSTTLAEDGLDITALVVAGTTRAYYEAFDQDGASKRRTNTTDDKPSKINIAAAKFLAEEALQEVRNNGNTSNIDKKVVENASGKEVYIVNLGLHIKPDLPLNGYEPRTFLEKFIVSMLNAAEVNEAFINRHSNESSEILLAEVDIAKERRAQKLAAARHARELLDR